MKNLFLTGLLLTALSFPLLAQQGVPTRYPGPGAQVIDPNTGLPAGGTAAAEENLPKFDLEFPGGTPEQLVDAIRAPIKFLNVIIPTEHKDQKLPPFKLRNVNVVQLFKTLEFASIRHVPYQGGQPHMQSSFTSRYGFQTLGPLTPESIWYFYVETPAQQPPLRVVRYYQLAAYLTEFTMDDIGSAIEAGWNMLGEKDTPKLNFHEDTKLLIAVGSPLHLEMISSVLKELSQGMNRLEPKAATAPAKNPGAPAAKL